MSCDAIGDGGLEQITTGANVFSGGGKRIDAVMKTKGFVQSLLFAEIKHHETDLVKKTAYREPDVYQASNELSGAVSQLQKSTHKAIKQLQDMHSQYSNGGDYEYDILTIKPRQVLVVGNLEQFVSGNGINLEKLTSFELFRRGQQEIEILTFDELFARAEFIAQATILSNN